MLDGVDLAALRSWMDDHSLASGPLEHVTLLTGGTQNILVRFERGGESFVLRRPPLHKRSNSDETMRREARALHALSRSAVPHPAIVASEPDDGVLGAAFYLMRPVEGCNVMDHMPDECATPAFVGAMGTAMVAPIAALAALDVDALTIGDLGRWDGWAERQVSRWRRQLDSYRSFPGYAADDLPGVDEIGRWLDAHLPVAPRRGLIHGDYHFANVIFSTSQPVVAAVVDWELVTIGDPLLDLAHLLATWPADGAVGSATWASMLPPTSVVIDEYAHATGRDLGALRWYRVLACYRLGLILEGTHARAAAGLAPPETGELLHAHTLRLLAQAEALLDDDD
jgi:aminoglycoside phosphotransferase (APT) family kinase protein